MTRKVLKKIIFAEVFSVLFMAGCLGGKSIEGPINILPKQDFQAFSDTVNEKTKEQMQTAERQQITPILAEMIENAYPNYQPRFVLPLPHDWAVAKDELRVLCRFAPGESFVLVASDSGNPEGMIYVFSTHALYVISGKTFACHIRHNSLYHAFEGRPYSQVIPYQILPTLNYRDSASTRQVTLPDGRTVKISKKSGIPACLDAIADYFKEPDAHAKKTTPPLEFLKGHTLIVPHLDPKMTDKLTESMRALARTNADMVTLAIMAEMETFNTPRIRWGDQIGFTDTMMHKAIEIARDNNLKIVLKPMVNCKDTIWRAWIDFPDASGRRDLAAWATWWDEYNQFILHYVDIAQKTGCEMVCLGCEMSSTESFEIKWRELIHEARKRYDGLLTYNVNHGGADHVRFWDALDVIGMSGYYHLGHYMRQAGIEGVDKPDYRATLSDLRTAWKPIREELRQTSRQWKKPIFFIECGVLSARGVSRTPWQHSSPDLVYDGQEQAHFYQAIFETFWDEPWFLGFAWWAWPPSLYSCQEIHKQVNFEIYCKPAEDIVRQWYGRPRPFSFQP